MATNNSWESACGNFRRGLDAHVGGELSAEAAHAADAHLKECAGCAALFGERLRVRDLVRRAVRNVESPPHLAVAVRAFIRQG